MASPPTASSSMGRPSSPSPARSLRNRMGTAMRRASSGLAFTKAGSLSRSESKSSLKSAKVDTAAPPAEGHSVPSPVIESPAGERAAEQAASSQPPGPSPLVQTTVAPSETASQASTGGQSAAVSAPAVPADHPAPAPETKTESANVTHQTSPPAPAPAVSSPEPIAPSKEDDDVSKDVPAIQIPRVESPIPASMAPESPPHPATDIPTIPDPEIPNPELARSPSRDPLALAAEPRGPLAFAAEERGADFFSWSDENALAPKWSSQDLHADAESTAEAGHASQPVVPPEGQPAIVDHAQAFAWRDDGSASKKSSSGSMATSSRSRRGRSLSPSAIPSGHISTKTSKSSLATSGYGQVIPSASRRPSVTFEPESMRRGRSSSVRMPSEGSYTDPFVDPPPERASALKKSLSPIESVREPDTARSDAAPELPTPAPSSFPLPPLHEVIGPSKGNGPTMVAGYNIEGATYDERTELETDETLPLLHRAASPGKNKTSYSEVATATVPFPSSAPLASYSLEPLGWVEYTLPSSSVYYYHAMLRVTTDLDLRNSKKIRAVTEYLDRKANDALGLPPAGWELWLRDAGLSRGDFVTQRCYVNHGARIVCIQGPQTPSGEMSLEELSEDDRIDMEYRYWTFMETHPAHFPLPDDVRQEAVDALTWCYTDCILPTQKPISPPFSPQECQELMSLLKSSDVSSSTTLVQTRIIARVLLRQAEWKQHYFRPNKPLPNEPMKGMLRSTPPRPTFAQNLLNVLVSCICLGIPYLFYDRSHHTNFDYESGVRSGGPMLMVGGCACLVAALILSASVTFLSLPGLDDVARLAALLAILFSASSMISAVISLFKYKADLERSIMYVGGEGLMLLSRRSIIMSLPLVFLAWAIAAFMTGITFYSFRGASVTGPIVIRHPFEDYTQWAVVGTMGGLGGMLLILAILARR